MVVTMMTTTMRMKLDLQMIIMRLIIILIYRMRIRLIYALVILGPRTDFITGYVKLLIVWQLLELPALPNRIVHHPPLRLLELVIGVVEPEVKGEVVEDGATASAILHLHRAGDQIRGIPTLISHNNHDARMDQMTHQMTHAIIRSTNLITCAR